MPAGLTRDHADAVGVALPAAEVRVMDDDGREVAPGEVGELWIGGPMVVPGYWGNAEATAASFTAGFWHSGDLGFVDSDGFVRIVDRKKDMLNRGGYKVYSVKVENVLMSAPGIVEAAVIGVPCPVLGERVHAVVYAPDAVRDAHRRRVPRPNLAHVPVSRLFDAMRKQFAPIATSAGLDLRVAHCRAVMVSDATLVSRIVANLLANAIRYTPAGSVLLGCRRRGDKLSIEVWDTGVGIAAEDRERIFEEFVHSSATWNTTDARAWDSAWRQCAGLPRSSIIASSSGRCQAVARSFASTCRAANRHESLSKGRFSSASTFWQASASW
ncbi:MAG TPA: ATP-binding protein [Caldimonas sp.]